MATSAVARQDVESVFARRTPRSRALHERAQQSLPGGDTRASVFYRPYPVYMAKGEGCRLHDVDGNTYLDFLGNYTSLVHGHAHPRIVEAVARQAALGTAHGAPVEAQVALAEAVCGRVAAVDRLRFTNSGSEAVMQAIRAARAFTGRSGLLKMEGGYHGTYDAAEVSVDPGAGAPPWPQGWPEGPGLSPGLTGEVLVAPFNDLETTRRIIEAQGERLAAVILEPALTAAGTIPADRAFLEGTFAAARAAGILLILDEVVTFRLAPGGAQALYDVRPDLVTFGKVIGGGLPVGAFGGRRDVMALFDPGHAGGVVHAGTFNGNAMTAAAGVAALELLTPQAIDRVGELGDRLRAGLRAALERAGVVSAVTGLGSLAHVHFAAPPIRDYRSAARGRSASVWRWLHLALLNRGIFTASRGMFVISTVMAEREVDAAIAAFGEALEDGRQHLEGTGAGALPG